MLLFACNAKKERPMQDENDIRSAKAVDSTQTAAKPDFTLDKLLSFQSEADLIKTYGADVKRSTGYYPEGMGEYQNTLLFPDTKNQVEFVWQDDSVSFSGLSYIHISGEATDWKTKEGITLGTTMKDLEKLNQKSFIFSGFGWDYSGATDWDNGHLQERKIFVNLAYPGENVSPEHDALIGDHDIRSDSELAQKVNPIVFEITMRK